jgi:hypothetical protein
LTVPSSAQIKAEAESRDAEVKRSVRWMHLLDTLEDAYNQCNGLDGGVAGKVYVARAEAERAAGAELLRERRAAIATLLTASLDEVAALYGGPAVCGQCGREATAHTSDEMAGCHDLQEDGRQETRGTDGTD